MNTTEAKRVLTKWRDKAEKLREMEDVYRQRKDNLIANTYKLRADDLETCADELDFLFGRIT